MSEAPGRCPSCGGAFSASELLEAMRGYASETDSGTAACPRCGKEIEFRAVRDSLELGYTYWSGSFHFEALVAFPAPGLRARRAGSTVTLELGGRSFAGG